MLFKVKSQQGETHLYTADRLYTQALKDSKRDDWNWFIPVTELANVVSFDEFPSTLAEDICCAILNGFIRSGRTQAVLTTEEQSAIQRCFEKLGDSDTAIKAKNAFLAAQAAACI